MTGHHIVVLTPEDHAAIMSGETVALSTEDGHEIAVSGSLLGSPERALLRQPGQQVAVIGSDGQEALLDTRLIEDIWTDDVFTIPVDDDARRLLLDGETVELEAEGGETFALDGSGLTEDALETLRGAGIARVALAEELLTLDASALDPME